VIDHVILNVRDYEESRRFYEQALEPLGYEVVMEVGPMCAFGKEGKPEFWIGQRGKPSSPVHVAFTSPDRATVDAFFEAAVAAGGADNGPPGPRTHYHEDYYGAFVYDPDRNNIEAVCHKPE
jgi:catechol 2,3-dioxygenase-like lactoylglutathione lyase family enzyme